jgi:hypothetical protein
MLCQMLLINVSVNATQHLKCLAAHSLFLLSISVYHTQHTMLINPIPFINMKTWTYNVRDSLNSITCANQSGCWPIKNSNFFVVTMLEGTLLGEHLQAQNELHTLIYFQLSCLHYFAH